MEKLREELMRRRASPFFVQGLAQAIAVHLARNYAEVVQEPRSASPSLPGFKLHQITDWMAEHLAEEFHLDRLAAQSGLSKFHFNRLFKSATGVSPSHYHINLRMDAAKRQLRETKKSVVEIAMAVGYATPSHFAQLVPPGNRPFSQRLPPPSLRQTRCLPPPSSDFSNLATVGAIPRKTVAPLRSRFVPTYESKYWIQSAKAQTWKEWVSGVGARARLHGYELPSRPCPRPERNDGAHPPSGGTRRHLFRHGRSLRATGEIEWMQTWRFRMGSSSSGFSSTDSLKILLPSSPV